MAPSSSIETHATALLTSARAFKLAAERPGSSAAAAAALASIEEAVRTVGAGWHQLAADAASPRAQEEPTVDERRLVGTLQDVGSAFTRCARVCRDAEYATARVSERPLTDEMRMRSAERV